MPYTAVYPCSMTLVPLVSGYSALEYAGHVTGDPIENVPDHVDHVKHYGADNKYDPIGSGLIGYFPSLELLIDLVCRLNFVTPPYEEGWRWQVFNDLSQAEHQGDFSASMTKGVTAILNPAGAIVGFMPGGPESAAVYFVLAVLNQGPAPRPGEPK